MMDRFTSAIASDSASASGASDLSTQNEFVLDRYEGYLLQITIGDKGSYLYATFGAPVAHENDIERAASAALDLRDLPATLDFLEPLQIGISRGLTHSGAYGGSHRRTYGIMGSEVNFSARLMIAARPGQILVSPRVAKFLSAGFALNPLPPMRMKGIDQPMAIFELAARSHGRWLTALDSPTSAQDRILFSLCNF